MLNKIAIPRIKIHSAMEQWLRTQNYASSKKQKSTLQYFFRPLPYLTFQFLILLCLLRPPPPLLVLIWRTHRANELPLAFHVSWFFSFSSSWPEDPHYPLSRLYTRPLLRALEILIVSKMVLCTSYRHPHGHLSCSVFEGLQGNSSFMFNRRAAAESFRRFGFELYDLMVCGGCC